MAVQLFPIDTVVPNLPTAHLLVDQVPQRTIADGSSSPAVQLLADRKLLVDRKAGGSENK